jgi:hypothetical protein
MASDRLLRHIPSGIIYIWQEVFAGREDFEPYTVPVEPAPEPAVTRTLKLPVKPKGKAGLSMVVEATAEEALSADASRGMP